MPNTHPAESTEPFGIVISHGSREESIPAVFAYVWGPAPETDAEHEPVRAPRAA